MMTPRWIAALALICSLVPSAVAQVAMHGNFAATKACPALQSIKKGTNPGNISVDAGKSYKLLGKNKDQASHYWIEVPDAAPLQRWVATDCGTADGEVAEDGSASLPTDSGAPFYVLAMSWQPAFCEGLPDKVECQSQTAERFDASHFTLHGLWPQPRDNQFCGVDQVLIDASEDHRWQDLPAPELSLETKAALDIVMPGTQSFLERHEWIKHGTCYPGHVAETYFKDALRLMEAINASPVQALLAANVGQTVAGADIRARFDEAFGAGAGQRIRIACKNDGGRRLIVELTLGLKGDISAGTPLADLFAASSPTDPGCPAGIVDPVGLQ
jgi:ribonuclease T2